MATVSPAQPYGLNQRLPIGPFLNNAIPSQPQSAAWSAVNAFPNLSFSNPLYLVPEPNSSRLYVVEQAGRIHFFTNSPGVSTKTLFLNLFAVTQGNNDCGMLGFAFHPEFGQTNSPNRRYVYVYYNYSPARTTSPNSSTRLYDRLSRFTVPDGSMIADTNSEQILINQYDENYWHNGGSMFFGPDGFLYLTNGDEGGGGVSPNNNQTITNGLFGGVLRIDVDQDPSRSHPIRRQPQNGNTAGLLPSGWPNSFTANYYIPNDNPWLDTNGTVLEEFYCIGLRSPHRMSYDLPTGRIWLGDVGGGAREEVDLIVKGGNYQWAYKEGLIAGPEPAPGVLIGTEQPPIYTYPHSNLNTAIIGGYVYRGTEHAAYLTGQYIFGDIGGRRIWAMSYDGITAPIVTELCTISAYGPTSFGVDHNNELYICAFSAIYKLSRTADQSPLPPALLSQTGVFTNLTTLEPNPALIPYDVTAPLWSDAAIKSRWMAVPYYGSNVATNGLITFATNGSWHFPTGTVFVKHFDLPINDTTPAVHKRLETRLFTRGTNGTWFGLTYKWRADNSDADLLPGSLNETNLITTSTGTRTQVWYYPSRTDCLSCHNPNAGSVLGPRTCQMNGDVTYPATGVTDNQLRVLNHVGLFDTSLNEAGIPALPKTASLNDTGALLETRMRSYLDSNCAHCHRPDGVRANFDARFDTPLNLQNIVNAIANDSLGIPGAKVVAPQNLAHSVLYLRDSIIGPNQMPPLAKNMVDSNYIAVLSAWINSLPVSGPLPAPWLHQDVGAVGLPGDADYLAGTFNLTASGVDIWGTADGFHFVYRPVLGDFVISARVDSIANTDPWAMAGVMIRQDLTAGSKHEFMALSSQNGMGFKRRQTPSGSTLYTLGATNTAPYWARLVRTGNVFTAYNSAHGTNWTQVGSDTNTMSDPVYVGLALTSLTNTVLGNASFSSVTLIGTNVNNYPVAAPDILTRWASQGVTTSVANLLTNDSDPDGDLLSILSVTNATPVGATLTFSNNAATYRPLFGDPAAGSFNYVISDVRGGTATGLVSVVVQPDPAGTDVLGITAGPGDMLNISLTGIAGFTYTVQFTDALTPPNWQYLTNATADGTGVISVDDTMPVDSTNRFYRAVRGLSP